MKKPLLNLITGFVFFFLLLSSGLRLNAQPLYPYGNSLGSRNQLGVYSPLATAAGETILSQPGPQAYLLNPGLLGFADNFQIAVSGRLVAASTGNFYNNENIWTTYSRQTLNPDFIGLNLKGGDWRIALGYSLIEEYNRPEILYYSDSHTQNGKLHGFQFGISRRLNEHLSFGLSFNYRTGKIKHIIYTAYNSVYYDRQVELNGFNMQFGLVWKMNDALTLALVLRPAYRMKVEGTSEERNPDVGIIDTNQFDTYLRFPLAITYSSRVKISENLNLYSDISYWNWKQFSGGSMYDWDLTQFYDWPQDHDDIKFSAGFDYAWKLRSESRTLRLAAGYIHDPYKIYTGSGSINDYLTCGLCVSLNKLSIEGSVKLPLAKLRDEAYIDSSSYQLGLNFRF